MTSYVSYLPVLIVVVFATIIIGIIIAYYTKKESKNMTNDSYSSIIEFFIGTTIFFAIWTILLIFWVIFDF